MPIHFFEEDITYNLKNKKALKKWLADTILAEGYRLISLTYVFCSDNYLLNINRQYLNHDTYTDIITFNNSEKQDIVEGEIYISIDRIRENALFFRHSQADELQRVMVHGVLHLTGYTDKTKPHKTKMTQKEDFYLNKRVFIR
jgi:probable rRNA maturation factor